MFLHFAPSDLESLLPAASKYEKGGELRLDAQSSSDLVVTLNIKTHAFFRAYADRFPETRGKQILLNFADQEQMHGQRISRGADELRTRSGVP
jgi:hypothetical protein